MICFCYFFLNSHVTSGLSYSILAHHLNGNVIKLLTVDSMFVKCLHLKSHTFSTKLNPFFIRFADHQLFRSRVLEFLSYCGLTQEQNVSAVHRYLIPSDARLRNSAKLSSMQKCDTDKFLNLITHLSKPQKM